MCKSSNEQPDKSSNPGLDAAVALDPTPSTLLTTLKANHRKFASLGGVSKSSQKGYNFSDIAYASFTDTCTRSQDIHTCQGSKKAQETVFSKFNQDSETGSSTLPLQCNRALFWIFR